MATLKDPDGSVALEGFYDPVRPFNAQERAALEAMPDQAEPLRRVLGLDAFLDGLEG